MELDLHGLTLEEAKEEIIEPLRRCENNKDLNIRIIHGYHKHILKDFIRSQEFLEFAGTEGYILKRRPSPKSGETNLVLVIENPINTSEIREKKSDTEIKSIINEKKCNIEEKMKKGKKLEFNEAKLLFDDA